MMQRDLDSKSHCAIARIEIIDKGEYDFPVVGFTIADALLCAIALKTCVLAVESEEPNTLTFPQNIPQQTSDSIRIEHQALHKIPPKTTGTLYLLEGAAHFRGKRQWPVSIWALTLPRDNQIRWYWTVGNTSAILKHLDWQKLISATHTIEPGHTSHHRLFTTLTTLWEYFAKTPDSPDYKKAIQITDYCPDIEEPDTACHRLEVHPYIYHSYKGPWRDMSDDRYLLELEPAERQVASMIDVTAAKYLLLKREYFREYMKELSKKRHKIPVRNRLETSRRPVTQSRRNVGGARGSTEDRPDEKDGIARPTKARQKVPRVRGLERHIYQLRTVHEWSYSKARVLVEAWAELGFLNEESFVDWIDHGGMFETISLQA